MKNYKALAFMLFIVLFSNCETENFVTLQNAKVAILKSNFSLENFKDVSGLTKDDAVINWNHFKISSIEEIEYYEFKIHTAHKQWVTLEGYDAVKEYTLLARFDENEQPSFFIAEHLPNLKNKTKERFYVDVEEYSGMIYLYTLEGKLFLVEAYKKGILIDQIKEEDLQGINAPRLKGCPSPALKSFSTVKAGEIAKSGDCTGGGGTGCTTISHTTYDLVDWYDVEYNNSTGAIVSATFLYTDIVSTNVNYYSTCNGSTGSTAYNRSSKPIIPEGLPANIEELLEEILKINIDDSLEDKPCQKDVVVKVYSNKSELSNFLLSAFGGDQDDVNLTYAAGDLLDDDDGSINTVFNTSQGTLNATITFDDAMLNQASDLYIATIAIHENLHATLDYAIRINDIDVTDPDPGLYELGIAYANWMQEEGNTNLDQHAYMATMIDQIATSLRAYGESQGYNLPNSYYNDLSWSGGIGMENPTFNGLSFSKKLAIRNAHDNERNKAETDGKGEKCD